MTGFLSRVPRAPPSPYNRAGRQSRPPAPPRESTRPPGRSSRMSARLRRYLGAEAEEVQMRVRALAGALGLIAVLASVGAVTCAWAVGWTFDEALNAFVVSNLLIGLSFALCGALIAWHRPASVLGWMYAGGGACQALSALAAPLALLLHDDGAATWLVRLLLTVVQWGWPVNIARDPAVAAAAPRRAAGVATLATGRGRARGHRAARSCSRSGSGQQTPRRPARPLPGARGGRLRRPDLVVDAQRDPLGRLRSWSGVVCARDALPRRLRGAAGGSSCGRSRPPRWSWPP